MKSDRALGDIKALIGAATCLVTDPPNLVGFDFADLRQALLNGGRAVFAQGEAAGHNRAVEAVNAMLADLRKRYPPIPARVYIAIVRKEDETRYCIDVPELPGCTVTATSLEKAERQLGEVLAAYFKGMAPVLPPPRSLEEVVAAKAEPCVTVWLIEVDPGPPLRLRFQAT